MSAKYFFLFLRIYFSDVENVRKNVHEILVKSVYTLKNLVLFELKRFFICVRAYFCMTQGLLGRTFVGKGKK